MFQQHQIAVVLQFVAGIADGARRAGMDGRVHDGGDIDAVILAAIGGGAEIGNHPARLTGQAKAGALPAVEIGASGALVTGA